MAESRLGIIEGATRMETSVGIWHFDEDDWLLFSMLCDPIYMAELLWNDPKNSDYGGCYTVIDYQYVLFRPDENNEGYPCARTVGKTESIKARAGTHPFRRQGEDLLVTAPELIHLMPLCDAVEDRLSETRLTDEFLDKRNGKTGFKHTPFQVDFLDGTRIVGRIPKLTGTGVKGMHEPDMIVDEGQDYPEKGWIEAHETVMKDHKDADGNPDYGYYFYGVHTGARDGRFYKLSTSGEFKIKAVTAMQRPGWTPEEKRRAAAIYGGTQSPDYRRNILGEVGGATSAFFVTARLMAAIDQDRESEYNTLVWKSQRLMAEELDKMLGDRQWFDQSEFNAAMYELLGTQLDIPEGPGPYYLGADIGLVGDPTVISLWTIAKDEKTKRDKLRKIRMWHLWRFRERMIRETLYHLGWKLGTKIKAVGVDVTGLGLPIFQAMEDDELAPPSLIEVTRGYTFSTKVPIGVDKSLVITDSQGNMRDHLGNMVEKREDPFTGQVDFIVMMSMIEASTRYLREFIDTSFLQLPFDTETAGDYQAETEQRVRAMAGMRKKVHAFHILDSDRAFAMAYKSADVEAATAQPKWKPVMAQAMQPGEMALEQG
jgi:hypothetical protein